jgi:hypothetical protein
VWSSACALVVVVAVLGGCSSPLSVDDYADQVGAAADGYVTESQALSASYQRTVEDGVRDIAASGDDDALAQAITLVRQQTVAYLAVLSDAMARYWEALDALDPPSAIEGAHDEYVAAIDVVLRAIPDTRAAVEAATDISSVQVALTTSGFADGQTRWTTACTALEQSVRDEGRGLDLGCTRPPTDG